ncbi:BNR/Asp-box repeat domain protein [Planococcus halocryophilus Or1]|nr:hypothetical protein [Planococcus halocryophilus]EMF47869.1 BNR/Asp-box repeat domain protein [Planococcus halocryophilus Or1]
MGYAGNNNGLYFAAHTGMKIYREGNWFTISDDFFDYMGFNAIDQGFYTSGHPSADSDMPNPLGIQKSLDGGKSLEHIAFEGETDFHALAVGYISQDIFLLNPQANSELAAGFYKLSREDKQWEPVNAEGLEGEVSALALHPTNSNIVAAATSKGIYVSEDGGEQFDRITNEADRGTAVFFNENELLYASYGENAMLTKYTVANKKEEKVNFPNLIQDEVSFISQNPTNKDEIGIYTMQGEVFLTKDNATTWMSLLDGGNVQ